MLGCEACQAQMLEHLYDLLDDQERQALLDHLTTCSPCQAALASAQQKQRLLATAARMELLPAFQFVPPAPAPKAMQPLPAAPVLLAIPARKPRQRVRWRRWAVAAGIVLALVGLSVPAREHARAYAEARDRAHQQELAVADARHQMEEATHKLEEADEKRKDEIKNIHRTVKAAGLVLRVEGAGTLQSGAPSVYQVSTSDFDRNAVSANIVAQLAQQDAPVDALKRLHERAPAAPGGVAGIGKGGGKQGVEGAALGSLRDDAKAARPRVTSLEVQRVKEGLYRVTVPANLALPPNRRVTLLVSAKRDSGSEAELRETLALTAPVYLTHLTTDKPMYQPGEIVHFRSLTLDRFSLAPPRDDFRLHFALALPTGQVQPILSGGNALVRDVKGNVAPILGPDGQPVKGVGAGEVLLPENAPGGEYALTVREERQRFPTQVRKFVVNRYQKPQLDKKLDFNRSSYGPGDEVQAACKAHRASNGTAVANRPVRVAVNVDDKTYGADGQESAVPILFRTDEEGRVLVRFKLPAKIEKGQASVAVTFDAGEVAEPIVRTIPVVVKKLRVEFFPEGGELVAGLPNRVYFEARTPLGKPADLQGRLVEGGKVLPLKVATLTDKERPGVNQGNGAFSFTPRAGVSYELQIDSPSGIEPGRVALPKVVADGVVMTVSQSVVGPGAPIRVQVRSTRERALMVGAYCRGRLLDSVRLEKGQTEAVLRPMVGPAVAAGGVCRVTVFEEMPTGGARRDLKPVAERLVYRHPLERVDVDIRPDQRRYLPGGKVKLSLATTDEKERFKPAFVMLAVVDESVVTLADEKTARRMPTHFLLTTEVRRPEDLEYADFLLDPHPKAEQALDLLLGTQGWRRFAEQGPERFLKKVAENADRLAGDDKRRAQEEAERFLVMIGQATPRTVDFTQEKVREKIEKVNDDFDATAGALVEKHDEARAVVAKAADDGEYRSALALLGAYHDRLERARRIGAPLLFGVLALAGLIALCLAWARPLAQAWPRYVAVAACGAALFLLTRGLGPIAPPPTPVGAGSELADIVVPGPDADGEDGMPPDTGPAIRLLDENEGRGDGDMAGGGQGKGGHARRPTPMARGTTRTTGRAMPAPGMPRPVPPMAPGGPALALPDAQLKNLAGMPHLRAEAKENRQAANLQFRALAAKADRAEAAGGKGKAEKGLAELEQQRFGAPGRRAFARLDAEAARRLRRGLDRDGWAVAPMVVREYAHQRDSNQAAGPRSDFAETLYWHPVLVLPDGRGNVEFDLCDSVTTFQVTAFAHTLDGRLGAATRKIESRLPFTLSPTLPLEVTAGDVVEAPLTITNNTNEPRTVEVLLKERSGLELLDGTESARSEVPAGSSVRRVYRFRPTLREGTAVLVFEGKTGPFADSVRGTIKVVPDGFPVTDARSDLLEGGLGVQNVELPARLIKGSLQFRVEAYPSTLADLQRGLAGLLREPNGCFEQASTSNYPNVLILDFLKQSGQASPEVERQARELLARGYQKLTSYECQEGSRKRGYEWFGGTAPPHEALTAYGLMQFRDMARVYEVDAAMVKRTRDYLLKQRDGKGGFKRNARAIDTFGRAPDHVTNAYIVWALTEGGKDEDVSAQLTALQERAKTSADPYFLALVANSLINRGQTRDALPLLKKLIDAQKDDGRLEALETSITGSGGRDLQIETTSLALLAWLKANPATFNGAIRKSVRWIGQQRGGHGAFGSTQSTILALKALIAYTKANKRNVEAGELQLYVGADLVARKAFRAGATEAISLEVANAEKHLKAGKNRVRLEVTGRNAFPYTVSWSYRTATPASAAGAPVRLTTTLVKKAVGEGDAVRLTVRAENASGRPQGMAVAIVGLPGGMVLPADLKQLRDLTRVPSEGRPKLGAFEVRGRDLVLYWRDLAKDEKVEVPIDLVCRVPGTYRGPASRAYLYYNADHKHWIEPLQVTIAAKAE